MVQWKHRIRTWIETLLHSETLAKDLQDNLAIQALTPLTTTYLPWSSSAMRPSGIVKVLNTLVFRRPQAVVECGSGLTTYYLAKLLKNLGHGHLYTIDHDLDWLHQVKGFLTQEKLLDFVTFIHAPLAPCALALDGNLWYDAEPIQRAIGNQEINCLIVDGPPAYEPGKQLARYPAVPFFAKQLAPACPIVLDDIQRPGERRIIQRWSDQLGISFQMYPVDGGIAVSQPAQGFNIE
ncbi:class I SAM-dependent methyltransferase [Alkalinema pantanalense]|uniref:class I SAM-dependent methyltransferase n=1 Tax=Alkalinema pantanalense TaxID=1620705 RepID=UPI003D6DE964